MSIVTSILAMNAPSFLELFDKQDRQTNKQTKHTILYNYCRGFLVGGIQHQLVNTPSCLDMGVTACGVNSVSWRHSCVDC